ncbi:MAG: hypothetical protein P8J32_07325 [bacterium]|nr:hypothetical protein [bacterium]
MTTAEYLAKASAHFGIDPSKKFGIGDRAFDKRCLIAYHAIKEMQTPYRELEKEMNSDGIELRLMWLWAEGSLNTVDARRKYNQFKSTL